MQNLLTLICDKSISNQALSGKLQKLPPLQIQQKQKINAEQFQRKINKQIISNKINTKIKQSDYSQEIEYKKQLAKQYLKINIDQLTSEEEQLVLNIQSLGLLKEALEINNKGKGKLSQTLSNFIRFQEKCNELKAKLKNPKLIYQIDMKYKQEKATILNSLYKLIQINSNHKISQNNHKKITIDNIIDEIIPGINNVDVFNHWMFVVFSDIIIYNIDKNALTLQSLKMEKESNKIKREIQINTVLLSFQNPQNINDFLSLVEQTFKLIRQIHSRIKARLQGLLNSAESSQANKNKYSEALNFIHSQQKIYWQKVRQDVLPSIYLFNVQNRNKLYQIFHIQQNDSINHMPSLLLSYKYGTSSKLTKDNLKTIMEKIVSLLIINQAQNNGKSFDQICFFLQASIEMNDIKKTKLLDADLSFWLVQKLIEECIDHIDYQKIQKLIKLQRSIRQFKIRKEKGSF